MNVLLVLCVGLGVLTLEQSGRPARSATSAAGGGASVSRLLRNANSLGDSAWCVEAKRVADGIADRRTAGARSAVRTLLRAQRSRKLDLGIVGSADVGIRRRLVESLMVDGAESDVDRRADLLEIAAFLGGARRELAKPFDTSGCYGISAGIGGGGPGSSPEVRAKVARYMAMLAEEIRKRNRACELWERRASLQNVVWELDDAIVGCIARRLTAAERQGALASECIGLGALTAEERARVRAGK